MSRVTEIIKFLQNYNAWRRGDETLEMPHPAEIGKNIQDAIVLLRKNAELEAELAAANERLRSEAMDDYASIKDLQRELATEREKVRVLRLACERLRDCDWVISLPDRMDAVREIAREALKKMEGEK